MNWWFMLAEQTHHFNINKYSFLYIKIHITNKCSKIIALESFSYLIFQSIIVHFDPSILNSYFVFSKLKPVYH